MEEGEGMKISGNERVDQGRGGIKEEEGDLDRRGGG